MGSGTEHKDENARIREFIELDKTSLSPDGGERFNRLIFATSPYLLQHADNPVDWYQWGDEAFDRARRENKPVFLSVGYATCHWCHVMAHESFADPEVARVLNNCMVAVKVDREERPDIDAQYMLVSQMMTGRGGWPLNVIMTPDRKPFFAATYLPKHARQGMPGFIELLERIDEVWRTRNDLVLKDCDALLEGVRKVAVPAEGALPGQEVLDNAYREFAGMYDPVFGGFGEAPKFPMPLTISFLVRYWNRTGSKAAREMAEQSLR
ncbi:thioredoxin domain-containing protein, partial [bacterium]|nr:thioredoxin domain-containing protein [bacterium]